MSQVDDIKSRTDIVDLIGEAVPLRRTGRTYKALCPFHAEKTPSFTVDPARQSWRCFGACSEGGDIFAWVMRREQVDFRNALHLLAERSGVPLEAPSRATTEREEIRRRLAGVNEAAATFYRRRLLDSTDATEARTYLEGRGLNVETGEAFSVGYAPDLPDALQAYLTARGHPQADIVAAGLAMEDERGTVDRFRGRLIFAIRDGRGQCVGFGARALSADGPKYLNTPQTELFDKSRLLFGLNRARDACRATDRVVIVEGYMDVIAAHQHSQLNVVASMGTALTEEQVRLIKPLTRNVVLALDADAAGAAATLRGIEVARRALGREADIRIVELPANRDPDNLIRLDPDLWADLLAQAPTYLDYRFARAAAARDLGDPRERAGLVDELLPLLVDHPAVQEHYLRRLAALGRVQTSQLWAELSHAGRGGRSTPRAGAAEAATRRSIIFDAQTDFLLELLIARPELGAEFGEEALKCISDPVAGELLGAVLTASVTADLAEPVRQYLERLTQQTPATLPTYSDTEARAAARDTLQRLRRQRGTEELRAKLETIAEYEREHRSETLAAVAASLDQGEPALHDPEITEAARTVLEHMAAGRELHVPSTDEGGTPQ